MRDIHVDEALWASSIFPEGIVERWFIADGTIVVNGAPMAEIRVEDALHEIIAPASGRLTIVAAMNTVVEPASLLAQLAMDEESDAQSSGNSVMPIFTLEEPTEPSKLKAQIKELTDFCSLPACEDTVRSVQVRRTVGLGLDNAGRPYPADVATIKPLTLRVNGQPEGSFATIFDAIDAISACSLGNRYEIFDGRTRLFTFGVHIPAKPTGNRREDSVTLPNIAHNKSPGTSGSRRSDDFTPCLQGRCPEGSVRSG